MEVEHSDRHSRELYVTVARAGDGETRETGSSGVAACHRLRAVHLLDLLATEFLERRAYAFTVGATT
jgi:hypothetical protein